MRSFTRSLLALLLLASSAALAQSHVRLSYEFAVPRGDTQDFVDRFDEAQLAIRRQTLVVRLHRMVQSGRLASVAHGHYALSEAERVRRSS